MNYKDAKAVYHNRCGLARLAIDNRAPRGEQVGVRAVDAAVGGGRGWQIDHGYGVGELSRPVLHEIGVGFF